MMVMVSASHFLTLYLGLELLSLSLYAMVALQRDSGVASEAAMKYFVLGALASGMLLYGMSMVYGVTGSLALADIAQNLSDGTDLRIPLVFGIVFIVAGLAFKLGAVPFHMWVPDVYHGAPTAMTLFIGSAPKIAAFAFVVRILGQGLESQVSEWRDMLVILAVLSMAVGNIAAIAQTQPQAHARLFDHLAHGLHAAGHPGRLAERLRQRDVLRAGVCADEPGRLRHDPAAVARRLRGRQAGGLQGASTAAARGSPS